MSFPRRARNFSTIEQPLIHVAQAASPCPRLRYRTSAQRAHDQRFGIRKRAADQYPSLPEEHREFAAALHLPPDQAQIVTNDLSANKEGARIFGKRYTEMVKQAQYALDRAPNAKIKATDLPASSLGQLSAWGSHLKRHTDSRPKGQKQ